MIHIGNDLLVRAHAQIGHAGKFLRFCRSTTESTIADRNMNLPVIDTNGIQRTAVIEIENLLALAFALPRQQTHLVIAVNVDLERLAVRLMTLFQLLHNVWIARGSQKRR